MNRELREIIRKRIDAHMRERLAGLSKRGGSHIGPMPKKPRKMKSPAA